MQDRPTAAELLRDIAELLEGDVVAELAGRPSQHNVRIAANLARIVQRELELGPAADARAHDALVALLGHDGTADELNAELAHRIRSREITGDAWPVVLGITKDKLAIVKPGYDDYDFADE